MSPSANYGVDWMEEFESGRYVVWSMRDLGTMMKRNVLIKEVPRHFIAGDAWSFLEETKPALKKARPTVVFDFSHVSAIDRSGIVVLMKCFEEILKQNGDIKVASMSAELAWTLQQTGLDQICDVYDNAQDAAESVYEDAWADDLYVSNPAVNVIHSSGD